METVSINRRYVINVWIASILTAPVLMLIIFAQSAGVYWNVGFMSFYILTVFVEVIFCLPTLFLHRLAFLELFPSMKSEKKLKIILAIISLLCLAFTFVIAEQAWGFGYYYDTLVPLLCFISSVVLSSFPFKTRTTNALPIT